MYLCLVCAVIPAIEPQISLKQLNKQLRMHDRKNATHGQRNTRVYRIWSGMKNRCTNPNNKD